MNGKKKMRIRERLNAIYYLSTLKNYRIVHYGEYVELLHWGMYGYCSQGAYPLWNVIEKVKFYE